jgi:hypothetical protein
VHVESWAAELLDEVRGRLSGTDVGRLSV